DWKISYVTSDSDVHPRLVDAEGFDDLALAQRADLIVDETEHSRGLSQPVRARVRVFVDVTPCVADQYGLVPLPRGFQAHVVVYAAVGECDLVAERRLVPEVVAVVVLPRPAAEVQYARRQHRRKRRRGRHRDGQVDR